MMIWFAEVFEGDELLGRKTLSSAEAAKAWCEERLEEAGHDPTDAEWEGGGAFSRLSVSPLVKAQIGLVD